ncbi:unnamed protein product [Protopolystoma xenopodis]|uniref:Uncharacterized protein n=1 Tax=Protopolystoma xenopodis TaxID=117903 RepID=A0A3S5CRE7_9PLAT|nr:unnamed protein product [Protopolystoma xenopodis]
MRVLAQRGCGTVCCAFQRSHSAPNEPDRGKHNPLLVERFQPRVGFGRAAGRPPSRQLDVESNPTGPRNPPA